MPTRQGDGRRTPACRLRLRQLAALGVLFGLVMASPIVFAPACVTPAQAQWQAEDSGAVRHVVVTLYKPTCGRNSPFCLVPLNSVAKW